MRELPMSADATSSCPNCGATMPRNLVSIGQGGYCDICSEITADGFGVDEDADNSNYRHPRA